MKRGLKALHVRPEVPTPLSNIPCPDEKGTESWGYAGDAMIWMSNIPCPDEKGTESGRVIDVAIMPDVGNIPCPDEKGTERQKSHADRENHHSVTFLAPMKRGLKDNFLYD